MIEISSYESSVYPWQIYEIDYGSGEDSTQHFIILSDESALLSKQKSGAERVSEI